MTGQIPTIMYHSVGRPNQNWIWHFLTIPFNTFEDHIAKLCRAGYQSITLSDLYNHYHDGTSLPPKPVILTFDDGYLDNWVYAAPILKKYGMRGIIFVNPEFIDPTQGYRSTLEDVWSGKIKEDELNSTGFLSWDEIKRLESEGVMDIQSHAMTHTWYFTGPEIIDFCHPEDNYIWVGWNAYPQMKPQYFKALEVTPDLWGHPVFEHNKSLAARRFYPDPDLIEYIQDIVRSRGVDFFYQKYWRKVLFKEVMDYKGKHQLNETYETDQEYISRLEWELVEAKNILENRLQKQVDYLCWPGGGYNTDSLTIAKKYYKGSTIGSSDTKARCGLDESGHLRIRRIGAPCILQQGKAVYYNGKYLNLLLSDYKGIPLARTGRRLLKLLSLIRIAT